MSPSMMTEHHVFLEPQDVLFLRGNKLFGDAGSYGESLIPPWPSVAAGALRSRMMADDRSLNANDLADPTHFTLTAFALARRDAQGRVEPLHPVPADLLVQADSISRRMRLLQPTALAASIASSAPLELLPALAESTARQKSSDGWWLDEEGWQQYLNGHLPDNSALIASSDLWKFDARIGIGLSTRTRRADDGKLFTTQAVALHKHYESASKTGIGFMAKVRCAKLPQSGLVRLGGDGRAAFIHRIEHAQIPQLHLPNGVKRFKVVLTTPGLFDRGWRLPGLRDDNTWQGPEGTTARLVSAAVPRSDVVSGWNLATWLPKAAQRAAPTGSIYWFDQFTGDVDALSSLINTGLWDFQGQENDPQRRSECFNRCAIGAWHQP